MVQIRVVEAYMSNNNQVALIKFYFFLERLKKTKQNKTWSPEWSMNCILNLFFLSF